MGAPSYLLDFSNFTVHNTVDEKPSGILVRVLLLLLGGGKHLACAYLKQVGVKLGSPFRKSTKVGC